MYIPANPNFCSHINLHGFSLHGFSRHGFDNLVPGSQPMCVHHPRTCDGDLALMSRIYSSS